MSTASDVEQPERRRRLRRPNGAEVLRALPTIAAIRTSYRRDDLRADLTAGLALTAVLVPVGMGYAQAAGLPAIAGLYATIGALVGYFLVGPSRILVYGPDSALLPLFAAAIVPLAAGDPVRAIDLAGVITIMAGLLCIAGAAARLGFLTDLLSRPIRIGYMNGIAVIILAGQLPKLLGFTVPSTEVLGQVQGLVQGIMDGKVVPAALALGIGSLAAILLLRRFARALPGPLVAVVAAGVIVAAAGLTNTVSVVGEVPRGLPALGIPAVSWSDIVGLFPTAAAVALISFADTSVISHSFATKRRERVDPDHELAALGVTDLASALVGGFAASGSATRTPVAEQAGSRTQVTGLVGAVAILALLLFFPGLLGPVPTSALAAVVISAAITLFDFDGVRHLWRVRRSEVMPMAVAFLAVTLFGALPGIGAAIGLSLLIFVRNAWRPYDAVLGRVANYKGYHDVVRHPEARLVPGLILYRWDAPLFFANAELFREHVLEVVRAAPGPTRWIAVAAEPITDVDTTAADVLTELIEALERAGTTLHFAEMKGRVKDRLRVYGIFDRIGARSFHPTVGSVVTAYLAANPDIEWLDWEDEPVPPEHTPEAARGGPKQAEDDAAAATASG